MSKGKYAIAEQVGYHGIYGELELICNFTDNREEINISLSNEIERWRPGILFGVSYFMERIAITRGLAITIIEVKFNEVDTNNTVIAFLTIHALIKATGITMEKTPLFDIDTISFMFPK